MTWQLGWNRNIDEMGPELGQWEVSNRKHMEKDGKDSQLILPSRLDILCNLPLSRW